MILSAPVLDLGYEYNNFLFAPIREERNGMPLSVLSAFARLDRDPWQEAAELANLPENTATQRLTSLIAGLPDGPSAPADAETIATRLVALLPHAALSNIPSRAALFSVGPMTKSPTILWVLFMIFALGVQWAVASRQPPPQVDNARTPVTSTALAKAPLSNSHP